MDPDVALAQIRTCMAEVLRIGGYATKKADLEAGLDAGLELVEAVQDLDEWLRNGGFPPLEWSRMKAL